MGIYSCADPKSRRFLILSAAYLLVAGALAAGTFHQESVAEGLRATRLVGQDGDYPTEVAAFRAAGFYLTGALLATAIYMLNRVWVLRSLPGRYDGLRAT